MNNKNRYFTNVISGSISLAVSMVIVKVIGFIFKMPLSYFIGDEGMGYFNCAYTAYAFFYVICTAGVPKAITLIISEKQAKNREDQIPSILAIAEGLFLKIGVALTVILIMFSPVLARLIGSSKSYITMIAIAPSIIFAALSGVLKGLLTAQMRLIYVSISQVIEGVFKLVFGILLAGIGVKYNLPLYTVSALSVIGISLGTFVCYLYLLKHTKTINKEQKTRQMLLGPRCDVYKQIFAISFPITISATLTSIGSMIDLILVMRCLGQLGYKESEVTAFYGNYTTIALSLFNFTISIITPISIAFMPLLREAFVKNEKSRFLLLEKSGFEMTAFVCAPIMFVLMFFSKELLVIAFPNADQNLGSILLCLTAPAIFFSSLLIVLNTSLESCGHIKAPLFSMLIGIFAKFIVNLILVSNPNYGICGAPIGTVCFYAVALASSLIFYGKNVDKKGLLLWMYTKPYFKAGLATVVSRMFYDTIFSSYNNLLSLFLAFITLGLIYIILSILSINTATKRIKELAYYTNFS